MVITHTNLVLPVRSLISLSKSAGVSVADAAVPPVRHVGPHISWLAGSQRREQRGCACQAERGLAHAWEREAYLQRHFSCPGTSFPFVPVPKGGLARYKLTTLHQYVID